MRNIEEIIVNKAVVNVLDRENNSVVMSEKEMELSEDTYEYFEKHILKVLKDDDAKPAYFNDGRNIFKELCSEIFREEEYFLDNCNKLSQYLFRCMSNDEKDVSGDAAFCCFESQEGRYLAVLKLNFTNSYCHYIKEVEGRPVVIIGMNRTGLPGLGQKVSKAAVLKYAAPEGEPELLVLDRDTEGAFVKSFLNCTFTRDRRENTRLIRNASEQFARKAFKDNAEVAERFRSRITERLRNDESLDIGRFADESFEDRSVKEEFKAAILSEGIRESEVPIDREWVEKKLRKKRLKVDKSIELYIDCEVYNDKEKFQIKRNGDGTIDIILKNVKNYIEK